MEKGDFMSPAPNDRVVKSGQVLTQRVWDLLDFISDTIGKRVYVAQGGFKGSGGASASSGTHSIGDVVDIDDANLTEAEVETVVFLLRYWNGCSWYRSPANGWFETGSHIHCVMRDSFYGLSAGAKQQVDAYDRGLNGLANGGPDYHPRPTQHHFTKENAVALTAKEIADAVWASKTVDPVTKKEVSMRTLLGFIRINAKQAATLSAKAVGEATDDSVDEIAVAAADELAKRISGVPGV
jgi:hypothetical protein